ncbi:MAG: right-handed parallel beta-helix repeat-containing protein [Thermoplasmata archaeon]|nr:right-handed parallel beta-helix repeat-containing protein [Thermoplasmata archaeon]
MRKWVVLAISFLLFIPFININSKNVSTATNAGGIFYVGGDGEGNYTNIQDAINEAQDGCIIYVYPKEYKESIVVDKSISLIGIIEDGEKPVINGSMNEEEKVVIIEANNCTFKNFVVMYGRGVVIKNSNYCLIENNEILRANPLENSTRYAALEIRNTQNCEIINNTVKESGEIGISLWKSSSVKAIHNQVSYNDDVGINIDICSNCVISYNNITKNQDGINLGLTENSTISFNNVYYNYQYGIIVYDLSNVTISNNSIHHHSYGGVVLWDSSYCTISENEIYGNLWGICVVGSMRIPWSENKENRVIKNNISQNEVGIYLELGRKNYFIMNNLIDNGKNAWFRQSFWLWDRNPLFPLHNTWLSNYWSDWKVPLPKPITGHLWFVTNLFLLDLPWFYLDWRPAMQPYEI